MITTTATTTMMMISDLMFCVHVFTGLTRILSDSRDYYLLLEAWRGWRKVPQGEMKELYTEFVELSNEGVRGEKYTNNEVDSFHKSLLVIVGDIFNVQSCIVVLQYK